MGERERQLHQTHKSINLESACFGVSHIVVSNSFKQKTQSHEMQQMLLLLLLLSTIVK